MDLHFQDTDGSIRFASEDMAQSFRRVVHAWPMSEQSTPFGPFANVRETGSKWTIEVFGPDPGEIRRNEINAICDLVVQLHWSRLRQKTSLMCLHAAGIEMGSSLVVFPSGRRAGKSTLTAELGRRGYRVFSDDVLAVDVTHAGIPEGLACGVAPRLRLPLPEGASDAFTRWVLNDRGPRNAQYKYLTDTPVASFGKSCPIGAIIMLNRVEEDVPPSFRPMDVGKVLSVLVHQNFGRFAHAGRVLAAFDAMARDLPCLELTYGDFERAADVLEDYALKIPPQAGARSSVTFGAEPNFCAEAAPFDPERSYRRRKGFHCVQTGDQALISDANGLGIFRMGQGMLPIWQLLEQPITSEDMLSVLISVYPEVSAETLGPDILQGLRQLNDAGLIEAVTR